MSPMAGLVLGPLLRYVGRTEATIWVETDGPCEVEILGRNARSKCRHHPLSEYCREIGYLR